MMMIKLLSVNKSFVLKKRETTKNPTMNKAKRKMLCFLHLFIPTNKEKEIIG